MMLKKSHRHTSSQITVPPTLSSIQPLTAQHPQQIITHQQDQPICNISFSLQPEEQGQEGSAYLVQVYQSMTVRDVAAQMCLKIGCEYQPCVEGEVKRQLIEILSKGDQGCRESDEIWRMKMEAVIFGGVEEKQETVDFNQLSFSTKPHHYFKSNLPNQILDSRKNLHSHQSNQNLHSHQSNHNLNSYQSNKNLHGIYTRSQLKRKETHEKLMKFKMERERSQFEKCTFKPKVNNPCNEQKKKEKRKKMEKGNKKEHFENEQNASFFKQEMKVVSEGNQKDTFTRLYEHAFQIRNKNRERLRTLESEEESKLSSFSFIPEINECSREICRMRSHSSLLSNISSVKSQVRKEEGKKNNEKQNNCTFQPTLSQNTKKLTENLPNFQQRLTVSTKNLQQKGKSQLGSNKEIPTSKKNLKVHQMKIKKQTYIIDDENSDDGFSPDKTEKKSFPIISPSNFRKNNHGSLRKSLEEVSMNSPTTVNISAYVNNSMEKTLGEETGGALRVSGDESGKRENRSEELYNRRKKKIFEAIFYFLTENNKYSVEQFSKRFKKIALKNAKTNMEMSYDKIELHPHLPDFAKHILHPMTLELCDSGLTLDKEEFLWALRRLYDGLSISDKGTLLGWGVKLLSDQSK